jgi:hypothetical protein
MHAGANVSRFQTRRALLWTPVAARQHARLLWYAEACCYMGRFHMNAFIVQYPLINLLFLPFSTNEMNQVEMHEGVLCVKVLAVLV